MVAYKGRRLLFIGSCNNAPVGTTLGQANGIQALDRSRQVIAPPATAASICSWASSSPPCITSCRSRSSSTTIRPSVSSRLKPKSIGLPAYRKGTDFPNPDFAALARACGGHGFKAGKPGELRAVINEALSVDGPAIVDCVVASDEMPNFPHRELDKIGNYAVAKVKEALLAFCGG